MTRIVQIADIHFGTENPVALEAFEESISELGASALAICGDLTQRGKRSEFRAARDWLDRFDLPKLVVAGNHDTPLLNLYERVVSPFDRHDDYFADLSGPVELDSAILVGMNTARGWQTRSNWAEGSVNLEDLESAIADAHAPEMAGKTSFLICHHPFLSPPDAPLRTATKRGRRASRRLTQSKVGFLLTGHVHAPSVTVVDHKDDAYVAVSSGTLSTRLREHPASFNVIDLAADACRVTVHNLHGDRFVPAKPHTLAPHFGQPESHVRVTAQSD
ncbi:metallophosphoesterase family protein [Henriciella mobilis]|uniref:Metallophosphoesterase n=1 Tax=Henriciella mobilis TaxID=2305467 RepID=A0A399RDX3_9PROT|nr:metallophosphoesterase [Henriciella mobilis]RIJ16373.1 metallophosphoesterase [Henriciella mobilis]RIJ22505.1 metallophosphoesterase [Henriciella mobilis]RIJ29720.1 metallophosphoesterase [Henriciella mobilis]